METYTLEDINSLQDVYRRWKTVIENNSVDLSLLKGTKSILPGKEFDDRTILLKIFRIVQWCKCPEQINQCSYNQKAPESRFNTIGNPVFYGTNHIPAGIMESILQSNTEVGQQFVIGEWKFNLKGLKMINFLYQHKFNSANKSEFIDLVNKNVDEAIEKRPIDEQPIIKQILELYHQLCLDNNKQITSYLGDEILIKQKRDLILYPTAIPKMVAINFAIPKCIADNNDCLSPIKFNYCKLESFDGSIIGYRLLDVGLPIDETQTIKWLNDKDSLRRYKIKDFLPLN